MVKHHKLFGHQRLNVFFRLAFEAADVPLIRLIRIVHGRFTLPVVNGSHRAIFELDEPLDRGLVIASCRLAELGNHFIVGGREIALEAGAGDVDILVDAFDLHMFVWCVVSLNAFNIRRVYGLSLSFFQSSLGKIVVDLDRPDRCFAGFAEAPMFGCFAGHDAVEGFVAERGRCACFFHTTNMQRVKVFALCFSTNRVGQAAGSATSSHEKIVNSFSINNSLAVDHWRHDKNRKQTIVEGNRDEGKFEVHVSNVEEVQTLATKKSRNSQIRRPEMVVKVKVTQTVPKRK